MHHHIATKGHGECARCHEDRPNRDELNNCTGCSEIRERLVADRWPSIQADLGVLERFGGYLAGRPDGEADVPAPAVRNRDVPPFRGCHRF